MTYHVNPETGNVLPCRAKKRCRFGSDATHYSTAEDARAAYEKKAAASALTTHVTTKVSKGAKLLLALDRAHHAISARLQQNEAEGRDAYDDGPDAEANARASADIDERDRLRRKLEDTLPWDDTDGPDYDDAVTVQFATLSFTGAEDRHGFGADAFTPSAKDAEMYVELDRASAVWVARLSTAEVKALVLYNVDTTHYAQHMAGDEVTVREWETWDPKMITYLHSALAKAPRADKPFVAYAGISGERTRALNEEARGGSINLNRVQSASANPAQVNGFMTPSDWSAEKRDETAVEFTLDRVASLSAFNVHKHEMELLVPPGTYQVNDTLHGVNYYWGREKDEERNVGKTADNTYVVR